MAKFDEFVNPKAMLTPGIAGSVTMLIANTLWVQFELQPKWTALIVSFLFGLLVMVTVSIPLWQRLIYYILNSLIIFSVGIGTNVIGTKTTSSAKNSQSSQQTIIFTSNAHAAPLVKQRGHYVNPSQVRMSSVQRMIPAEVPRGIMPSPRPAQQERQFFRNWF